jgi:hypothetical protein
VKSLTIVGVLLVLSMAPGYAGLMPRALNDRSFVALPWNRGYYMISSDSKADVRLLFGRPEIQSRVRGYEVWYYQIRVYNPFEEFPSHER